MQISIDAVLIEMVRNEVAAQLAAREPLNKKTTNLDTKSPPKDEVKPDVDVEAETTIETPTEAKPKAKRKPPVKVEDPVAEAEEAEAKVGPQVDREEDFGLDMDDDTTEEMSSADLVDRVKAAMKASGLPPAQAKSLAKDVLSEEFDLTKFSEVPSEKRSEALTMITKALKA